METKWELREIKQKNGFSIGEGEGERERERLSFFKCVLYRRFEHRALRLGVERRIGQRGKRGNEGGKKKASFNSLTFCFRIFLICSFVFCS